MEVTINGKKKITSIKLAEEIVASAGSCRISSSRALISRADAIVAAANEELRKADENAELYGQMTED